MMINTKNIAIITRSFDHQIGGMEIHTRMLADHLLSRGCGVDILTPELALANEPKSEYSIIRVSKRPNKMLKYSFAFWRGVARQLKTKDYDAVINISMGIAGCINSEALHGQKIISVYHSTYRAERHTLIQALRKHFSVVPILGILYTYIFEFLQKKVYERSDYNIAVAAGVQSELTQKYKRQCLLMNNGIDLKAFQYIKRDYSTPIKFLFLARLHKQKGIHVLLNAINILNKKHSRLLEKAKFTVVGDGPEYLAAKQFIIDNKMEKLIDLAGSANRQLVQKYMHDNDIYLFPTTGPEGLPFSVLEAMATGMVPVASNLRGANQVVKNGISGLLINDISSEKLATEIMSIVNGQYDLDTMSLSAHQIISKKYNAEEQLKIIDALI